MYEFIISLILLLLASIIDVKTKKIPNMLTFPAILLGIIWIFYTSISTHIFTEMIFRLVLFVLIFFFGMTGLIGLGDIKLFMALSLLNSPFVLLSSIAIAGFLLVIVKLVQNPNETKQKMFSGIMMVRTKHIQKIDKDNNNTVAFAPYITTSYLIIGLAVKILCVI